jgi:hypothetical protein
LENSLSIHKRPVNGFGRACGGAVNDQNKDIGLTKRRIVQKYLIMNIYALREYHANKGIGAYRASDTFTRFASGL